MTSDEKLIRERYEREYSMYEAWGHFVTKQVTEIIRDLFAGGPGWDLSLFLKVSASPRMKDVESLVTKALYRGKDYSDPYSDITDKVGVRFVVLLEDDVRAISERVNASRAWRSTRDRDFESERKAAPNVFDYQSVHHIVRSPESRIEWDGTLIAPGIPCEVQIRTLLQHAFAELTHDTVYKPRALEATPEAKRVVARSMALIETTDLQFSSVAKMLQKVSLPYDRLLEGLAQRYSKVSSEQIKDLSVDTQLVDTLSALLRVSTETEVDRLLANIDAYFTEERLPSFADLVARCSGENFFLRRPISMLLTYLAAKQDVALQQSWPHNHSFLQEFQTFTGRTQTRH